MDYIGSNCPVCDEKFINGDDIVVCPECGTPHHRMCYEELTHCVNEDKHEDGFVFSVESTVNDSENNKEKDNNKNPDIIICPRCKTEAPKGAFYCGKCGFPIGINKNADSQNSGQPFTMTGMTFDPFDPMGGVDPETDMGDGVTAGEMSKYVQKSTSYFSRVFYNLKKINKGKFSFCGFLFTGGYLLYRKMYKIGTLITAIMLGLMVVEAYICVTPAYNEFVNELNSALSGNTLNYYSAMAEALANCSPEAQVMMNFISISSLVKFAIQIITGLFVNKWYFKHCKKKIIEIKNKNDGKLTADSEIKGGVNMPIALSIFIAYIALSYLPTILLTFNIF